MIKTLKCVSKNKWNEKLIKILNLFCLFVIILIKKTILNKLFIIWFNNKYFQLKKYR